MITTVMLDVDNTLLDFNKCAACAMQSAMGDWHLMYTEDVYQTFQQLNQQLWQELEVGKLTQDELYRIRWQLIFDRLNIRANGEAFEILFLKYLREGHEPVDGALELLDYLSEKYTLCIASNAPYEQQLHRLELAGILPYFNYLFISEKIGYPKPGREFFDACFAQLGHVSSAETMMIGDSLTADISGGIEYGIRTCWYNHDGIANKTKWQPDHTVDTLGEIRKFL